MIDYRHYRRHRTRVVTRPARTLSALAFVVVGACIARGWFVAAALVVSAYVVLGGRIAGRAPTWHVYAFAAVLLLGCSYASWFMLQGVLAEWYALAFFAAAIVCAAAGGFTGPLSDSPARRPPRR